MGEHGDLDFSDQSCQEPFSQKVPPVDHNVKDALGPLDKADTPFDPVTLIQSACDSFLSCNTGLACFVKRSLQPSRTVQGEESSSLWPVPPPRWRWSGENLGTRRRKRHRLFAARHRLLQVIIGALNWETLGHPKEPPPHACLGSKISRKQHEIIERLEGLVVHFCDLGAFTGGDLGRSFEKFQDVLQCIQELPLCKLGVEDLHKLALHVQFGLNPYDSHFSRAGKAEDPPQQAEAESHHHCGTETDVRVERLMHLSRPVESDRIKWENPPSFDASAYLSNPLVRAAFEDPEILRKPKHEWPSFRPAKVHCDKGELLKLAKRWDDLGACTLVPAQSKNLDEAVGLFCVPKDQQYDRLIINPKVINSRMDNISDFTKSLAPGAMLGLLHLEAHEAFRFAADDLSDYYYTIKVSDKRAHRNAIRHVFAASELSHLACFDRDAPHTHYLVALKSLAMGDSLAVEVGQQSHYNVLKKLCGAMRPGEVLKYREPCPRSNFVELLAIDDHVGIQKLPLAEVPSNPPLRDTEVFAAAGKAYRRVGLVQHEKKQKRNCTSGTILGSDFDGILGRVSAPRSRVMILILLSLEVAHRGTCTPKLLSCLVGCWVHVFLFRRVIFAVMDSVFKEGRGVPQNRVFCLSRQSRNELQMMALMGPLAQANLRVDYLPYLFCTDASPDGGAVCRAHVGSSVIQELWRHSEQKGFYTRLQCPASAYLSEKGFDSDAAQSFGNHLQNEDQEIFEQIPSSLQEGVLYDVLEIFRGSGNWSECHSELGLRTHDGIDLDGQRLRVADFSSPAVFHELRALACRRVVREWHAGVPCPSFGTLRSPQVRSKAKPFGFNPKDPYTRFHNMLAHRACFILTLAVMYGQYISVEQPEGSRLYLLHCFKTLIKLGCVISHYAFCSYGSGFQKRSKWLHNKPWLIPLESRCSCTRAHFVIKGHFTRESLKVFEDRCTPSSLAVYGRAPRPGERVSSYSGAYPVSLMKQMAEGSVAAKSGHEGKIPYEVPERSCLEVGLNIDQILKMVAQEVPFEPRVFHEDPEWLVDLSESVNFHEMFRFKFHKPGHINVNETRTYKTWLKAVCKQHGDCRTVALLDSRVTIGASAKGRSSSFALSRVLQGSVAYVLGSGLYPGSLHTGSKSNRADEPSRGKPVRGPTKEKPVWLNELADGKTARFDLERRAAVFSRNPARWLRFLLLLCGDIEPNPGPGLAQERHYQPRGALDMAIGFAPATAERMQKCLDAFRRWLEQEAELSWEAITSDAAAIGAALRGYGLFCFERGLPRYLFVYAITAMQDQYPFCKNQMNIAWQVDRKWQAHEPGQCRAVLPPLAIRAALTVAAIWNWLPWVGLVLLGFSAMLHPGEMLSLTRADLVFPRDVEGDMTCLFVHVRNPKTARFARRQHGRIDDGFAIWVLEKLFFPLKLTERLYPGTALQFRKQWDSVMQRLGIPCRQSDRGATPGVLRGSGATFLYTLTENVQWIAWRGRWARTRTLEFYLQEVAAQLLLHQLSPISKSLIREFDSVSYAVLCSRLSCGAVPKKWK